MKKVTWHCNFSRAAFHRNFPLPPGVYIYVYTRTLRLIRVALSPRVSGCSDHFASSEKEAYECIRNIISTLNYDPLPEEVVEHDSPLYSSDELLGLAPQDCRCTLPVKLVR